MNDIIKVILLNFILFYFLIKKNKSLSMFLIVILFMFLLYLRARKLLEGQSNMDEKKGEVKFMKMANLDRLLGYLLNVYEHSEEDCIGNYSEFTPCDKKCGITHKYKTYRIDRQAGLLGKSCVEEDGRRKKELCDESDGVYKCIIGESCQEDGDCESNNCDPKTNSCVPKKVCSNTNLDLCNKEKCIDLNNHYDYAKREFKYDEAESGIKCKLEDKETDSEEDDEEEEDKKQQDIGIDLSTLSAAQCDGNERYWYLKSTNEGDGLTSSACTLKIPNSVYYENEDSPGLQERLQKYGKTNIDIPKLYCNIGKKFCPNEGEDDLNNVCDRLDIDRKDMVGVTLPILSSYIEGISSEDLQRYCVESIGGDNRDSCDDESNWPPYSYFENNKNFVNDTNLKVPIEEMCGRCNNRYRKDNSLESTCYECIPSQNNQFSINESGSYTILYSGEIGNNPECLGYSVISTELNCNNINLHCSEYKMIDKEESQKSASTTYSSYKDDCCNKCEKGQRFENASCTRCPNGKEQNPSDMTQCIDCPNDSYSNYDGSGRHERTLSASGCIACEDPAITSRDKTSCSASYCRFEGIVNGGCIPRNPDDINLDNAVSFTDTPDGINKCMASGDKYFGSSAARAPRSIDLTNCTHTPPSRIHAYRSEPHNSSSIDFYDKCCKRGRYCPADSSCTNPMLNPDTVGDEFNWQSDPTSLADMFTGISSCPRSGSITVSGIGVDYQCSGCANGMDDGGFVHWRDGSFCNKCCLSNPG